MLKNLTPNYHTAYKKLSLNMYIQQVKVKDEG